MYFLIFKMHQADWNPKWVGFGSRVIGLTCLFYPYNLYILFNNIQNSSLRVQCLFSRPVQTLTLSLWIFGCFFLTCSLFVGLYFSLNVTLLKSDLILAKSDTLSMCNWRNLTAHLSGCSWCPLTVCVLSPITPYYLFPSQLDSHHSLLMKKVYCL